MKLDEALPPLNLIKQATLNLRLNAGFLLGLVGEQIVQLLFEVIDADFGFRDRQQLVEPVQPFGVSTGFKLAAQVRYTVLQLEHRCASGVAGIAHVFQLQLEVLALKLLSGDGRVRRFGLTALLGGQVAGRNLLGAGSGSTLSAFCCLILKLFYEIFVGGFLLFGQRLTFLCRLIGRVGRINLFGQRPGFILLGFSRTG